MKVIKYQTEGTKNRKMVCYETDTETQRAIRELNRCKGWKAEKKYKG